MNLKINDLMSGEACLIRITKRTKEEMMKAYEELWDIHELLFEDKNRKKEVEIGEMSRVESLHSLQADDGGSLSNFSVEELYKEYMSEELEKRNNHVEKEIRND